MSLHSQSVSACLTRLYLSLAQLIRWADQVMLGVAQDNEESTARVTTVIRAVLDEVKVNLDLSLSCPMVWPSVTFDLFLLTVFIVVPQDLVRLAEEKGSAPLSPVQLQPVPGETGGTEDQGTSDRVSICSPAQEEEVGGGGGTAPPKPLMPPLPLPQPNPQALR